MHAMDGGRVRYLDGLRGVAALIVLITHISITLVSQFITVHGDDSPLTKTVVPFGKLPIGFLWNGNSAVCVFFILSGFVMADFGFRTKLGLTAQVARRYVRLALPILLTSTFAYLFMKFGLFRNVEAGQVIDSGWLATWYNFAYSGRSMIYESLFETFLNGTYLYNANLWTMQSELIGSIAILSIVSLSRDRKERVAFYLLFAAVSISTYLPLFAAGSLLREFKDNARFGLARNTVPVLVFAVGCYFCSMPAASIDNPLPWHSFLPEAFHGDGVRYLHEIGSIFIVWGLICAPSIQAFFASSIPQWLGRISFTLYLIHIPLLCSLTSAIILMLAGHGRIITVLVCGPVTLFACLGMAAILTPVVDRWPILLSRFVGDWIHRLMHGLTDDVIRMEPRSRAKP
jgi:peptidoglycan/LPS O-acetylase OafA/YrhL